MPTVFVHVVTWNSPFSCERCVEALFAQQGFSMPDEVRVVVTDNASSNGLPERLRNRFGDKLHIVRNDANLGFCAGHNQGAALFLQGGWDYFLIINPDLRLEPDAIRHMVSALENCPEAGSACPKLFRADAELNKVNPPKLDAAGMYMTPALRHFDRGSGEPDDETYSGQCFVFGGSGACLLMKRAFVKEMLLECGAREKDTARIYPQLAAPGPLRAPLFDEAFFAYREDADLAWRSQLLGWKCLYVPQAVGYHCRVVLPELRRQLPEALNLCGVRNRFLLQLNNYSFVMAPKAFLPGVVWRNLVVIMAVLLCERSSLPALRQVFLLWRRAWRRRRAVFERREELLKQRGIAGSLRDWLNGR